MKAENTAQPHVLLVRTEIEALLPNPMDTITPVLPKTEAQWKDAERHPLQGHGWRYERHRGNVYFLFETPILSEDVAWAMYRGMVAGGFTAQDSPFIARMEGKKATQPLGDAVGQNLDGHKSGDIIMGRSRLLVETTKMGCYSWNLPAGPLRFGGACPGANMAFDVDRVSQIDPMAGVRVRNAVRRAKTYAVGKYEAAVPKRNADIARRFICNGCYAMKNSYGNPSTIVGMAWKRLWLRGFALPTGQFVPAMVGAIQVARQKCRKARKRAGNDPRALASIAHPDFFRIHDSGDFFSREYLEAWLDICRALPDVHFWAPSRIWTTASLARDLERIIAQGKLPKNLALRPSGLFFDGPEPNVPGLAGGTSSGQIVFEVKRGRIHLDIASTGPKTWGCPAYLPEVMGGGALPLKLTDRELLLKDAIHAFGQASIEGSKGNYTLLITGEESIRGKTVDELRSKFDRRMAGRKSNPVRKQSYAMYPPIDDATLEDPRYIFYDALFDPKTQRFIIDQRTGRPVVATKAAMAKHPGAVVTKAQAYQAAGACSVARDPKQATECRVCWGTSGDKRSKPMKGLPVVYGKH